MTVDPQDVFPTGRFKQALANHKHAWLSARHSLWQSVSMTERSTLIWATMGNMMDLTGGDFFVLSNLQTPYKDHCEIEADIKDAVAKGQLQYSGYILYYFNHHK